MNGIYVLSAQNVLFGTPLVLRFTWGFSCENVQENRLRRCISAKCETKALLRAATKSGPSIETIVDFY